MKKNILITVLFYSFLCLILSTVYIKAEMNIPEPSGDVSINNKTNFHYIVNNDSIPKNFGSENEDTTQYFINYAADLLWEYDLKTVVSAIPLIKGSKIYVATRDGNVNCFNLNGQLEWQTYISGTIQSQPVVVDDILAVGSLEGDITTLNARTGKLIQVIGLGEPITAPLISFEYLGDRSIIIDNDMLGSSIIIGTESGKVFAYDISSLGYLWESADAKGSVDTKPIFLDNKVIYMSSDGYTYCLDSRSGTLIWKWTDNKKPFYSSPNNSPVTDGKNVYIAASENSLYAVDVLLGKSNWGKSNLAGSLTINLSSDSSKIFATSSDNRFYSISAKDGKLIKELNPVFVIDANACKPVEVTSGTILTTADNNILLVDKQYNQKPVLFLGKTGLYSVQKKSDTIYALTVDGKMFAFEVLDFAK